MRNSEIGDAIIRIRGVRSLPPRVSIKLDPPSNGRKIVRRATDWPRGRFTPKSVRLVGDAAELVLDTAGKEFQALKPGTPVVITIPEIGVSHELRWPRLATPNPNADGGPPLNGHTEKDMGSRTLASARTAAAAAPQNTGSPRAVLSEGLERSRAVSRAEKVDAVSSNPKKTGSDELGGGSETDAKPAAGDEELIAKLAAQMDPKSERDETADPANATAKPLARSRKQLSDANSEAAQKDATEKADAQPSTDNAKAEAEPAKIIPLAQPLTQLASSADQDRPAHAGQTEKIAPDKQPDTKRGTPSPALARLPADKIRPPKQPATETSAEPHGKSGEKASDLGLPNTKPQTEKTHPVTLKHTPDQPVAERKPTQPVPVALRPEPAPLPANVKPRTAIGATMWLLSGAILATLAIGSALFVGARNPALVPAWAKPYMMAPSSEPSRFANLLSVPDTSPMGRDATTVDAGTALTLADRYLSGDGVTANRDEAKYWLRRVLSLEIGSPQFTWATTQLGTLYATPQNGAAPDFETARLLWEIAAARGDAVAMCFLGRIFERGLGTVTDQDRAASLYREAAARGGCQSPNTMTKSGS